MQFRRRRSLVPRPVWPRDLERTEPLRGQVWTRSERGLREPDVHWAWRALAATVAVAEMVLLGWLWFGPALSVQTVEVVGAVHLSPLQVAHAAGLDSSASIISVDGVSDRDRLLHQVWIRSASVEPQLPWSVVVHVAEWQPVAAYHSGPSTRLFLLSSQAVVLGPAGGPGTLVQVQGPAGSDPRVGDRPLDPALLTALVNIQRGFPSLVGQEVGGFIFDSCGDLTLVARHGWKVYFGRVLTPEEFASLEDKLSALKAIAGNGNVNYASTDLEYVNVMNPSEPAVGYHSKQPAQPSPAAGASPGPSPSPSPSPCR